jgi:hypothetical protein
MPYLGYFLCCVPETEAIVGLSPLLSSSLWDHNHSYLLENQLLPFFLFLVAPGRNSIWPLLVHLGFIILFLKIETGLAECLRWYSACLVCVKL